MNFRLNYCFLSFLLMFNVFAEKKADFVENTIKTKEVIFGQTGTLSGHLGLYGNLIKNAINACFNRINESGGVNGYKLRLESLDDHGDPVLAKKNIISLLRDNKIDMFLGCTGTRSVLGVLPMIKSKKIAMLFPWAGHSSLRDPSLSNIVNGLGDLQPQLEMIAENVVKQRKLKKIAIFHADDDFSVDAANSFETILQSYGVQPTSKASYNRMTVDVVTSAEKLLVADPKVVVCISTSMPAVKLIEQFFKRGHYATEFVGVDSTLFVGDILKDKGAHFSFSSCVPDPRLDQSAVATQYRQDIDKYYPNDSYNILSFSYYISALIIVEAIKNIKGDITKEAVLGQIEALKVFDIGGFTINFDATTRHAFGMSISIING
ncbi:MAG: Extracellular ligand-binding receptor [candidate division TM6 bacterium GW2011_GWF2_37_49]|nr:MAG: Extracellular ligand-binding receptor [candidate division TM6 bacterium GW2011_GWF2_37_49]